MRQWVFLGVVAMLIIAAPFGVIEIVRKEVAARRKDEELRTLIANSKKIVAEAQEWQAEVAEMQQWLDEYYSQPADALKPIRFAEVAEMRQWLNEFENRPADALDAIFYADLDEAKQLLHDIEVDVETILGGVRQGRIKLRTDENPISALHYENH